MKVVMNFCNLMQVLRDELQSFDLGPNEPQTDPLSEIEKKDFDIYKYLEFSIDIPEDDAATRQPPTIVPQPDEKTTSSFTALQLLAGLRGCKISAANASVQSDIAQEDTQHASAEEGLLLDVDRFVLRKRKTIEQCCTELKKRLLEEKCSM